MLDSLDRGGWELRYRAGTTPRAICVRTGRELIQLRHDDAGCNSHNNKDRNQCFHLVAPFSFLLQLLVGRWIG